MQPRSWEIFTQSYPDEHSTDFHDFMDKKSQNKFYKTSKNIKKISLFYRFEFSHIIGIKMTPKIILSINIEVILSYSGPFIKISVETPYISYHEFMKFRETNKLPGYACMPGYNCNADITDQCWDTIPEHEKSRHIQVNFRLDKIYKAEDAEDFTNELKCYFSNSLPSEVYQQLRVACGLLPIRDLDIIRD